MEKPPRDRSDTPLAFRKAAQPDLASVWALYRAAIAHMDAAGIHQWDELYPAESVIRGDLGRGELYVGAIEGTIASAFALSPEHDPEYEAGRWECPDLRYCVIHRLCVHPDFQNRGVATQTMRYIEETLRAQGYEAVRLDAFSQNPAALRLYEGFNYQRVGEVTFRKGLFFLFEKRL